MGIDLLIILPPRPEHCLQVNLCYLRVGGLLSSQKLYPFMDRGSVSDFNQATDAGTYKVSNVTSNIPTGAYNYGVLHVGVATNLVSQLYIPDDNSSFDYKIFVRIRFGESWRRWRWISMSYV